MTHLISVDNLSLQLPSPEGYITIFEDLSFEIGREEVLGLAGESGSGKTMAMLTIIGILPRGARVNGTAYFNGVDLLSLSRKELRHMRGASISMVFQDPMSSLHPMLSVGRQMTDHMRYHLRLGRREAERRAAELLDLVRIPDPDKALRLFPHHFSGGMRQRIAIAMALACSPQLMIADEPTTALDVTVQAGILRLFENIRQETGLAIILITHDLGLMASTADRVVILYAGRAMEMGPVKEVLETGRHPYTRGLLEALPDPKAGSSTLLKPLRGSPPTPIDRPPGCPFNPRCAHALSECGTGSPPSLQEVSDQHSIACPVDPFAEA